MEWFWVTWNMYRRVFTRAAELALRNWWVLITTFVYSLILALVTRIAPLFGFAGGFLFSLVWAACIGSFLYLVEMMVRTSRVTVQDFQRSFGAYLWDVIGVSFLVWIFWMFATPALAQMPQGYAIVQCIRLAAFVLFNALPELIYLGHHSSLQLFGESYSFIGSNWIEWFPANLLAAFLVYLVLTAPLPEPLSYVQLGVASLLLYFTMVMRGLLFQELNGTSRRGRAFKYRSGMHDD